MVALALAVSGCADDLAAERPSIAPDDVPPSLAALPQAAVKIGELELGVAVADTPATRSRGLMHIDDLGSLGGMVFVFETPTETGFHMKNVPGPLDIAFIDADRSVIAVLTMATCPADPCPTYRSPAPFQWALETPASRLADIEPGDRFSLAYRASRPGRPRGP